MRHFTLALLLLCISFQGFAQKNKKKKEQAAAPTSEKPEIVVTSASVQILYAHCGNVINIDVPDLGDLYNPLCTATDADITQSKDNKNKFLVVPRANKCVIEVSNRRIATIQKIGAITYNVIPPPKPSIQVLVNGNAATGSTIIKRGDKLVLKIIPDPDFRNLLPIDARYEISEVTAYIKCADGSVKNVGGALMGGRDATDGLNLPIPGEAFDCESGAKVFFVITDINRKNFQGKKIKDERFTDYEKEIHILLETKKETKKEETQKEEPKKEDSNYWKD